MPCICSVIDHGWRQNVVRAKKCHWFSYWYLTDILLLNRRTATWNLFLLYNKKKTYNFSFLFQNISQLVESRRLPTLANTKKSHLTLSVVYTNEAISLVAMHNKDLWLVKKNGNLQREQNWTAKSTNVKENAGKINSVFVIRAALWAKKLECFHEYCWSWKNTLGKHAVAVNTGRHLIRVLNERRVTDDGNLCPPWLVILKLVWHGIGDTLRVQYSWPRAVVSYTFLAVVPWNGLEHSRRKVRLRVYFDWIKEVLILCFIPDINLCQQLF